MISEKEYLQFKNYERMYRNSLLGGFNANVLLIKIFL